jgi:serine/threonine protein kinase
VLDQEGWNSWLQTHDSLAGRIILIGSTAPGQRDFHNTPFAIPGVDQAQFFGVELHATAIANLAADTILRPAIGAFIYRGLFVGLGVLVCGLGLRWPRQFWRRSLVLVLVLGAWLSTSYYLQQARERLLPTAVPVSAFVLLAATTESLNLTHYFLRQRRIRAALEQYAAVPAVQAIINQDEELRQRLQERQDAIGGTVLAGRYCIRHVIGMGGFSETYKAEDQQRPGHPICVVKQFRINHERQDVMDIMRRSFMIEAEVLEQLGRHHQIPQLLAYFEEAQEFYLVQEFIAGIPLGHELKLTPKVAPEAVAVMMADLLPVLDFVHHHGIVHRDIKPSNIIRRSSDHRLVLIDFGIAKTLSAQYLAHNAEEPATMGMGTQGYMPAEQSMGQPRFASDLYALGMVGIQALTGLRPHTLSRDRDGELVWQDFAPPISHEFKAWFHKMIKPDIRQRYQSANEAIQELLVVEEFSNGSRLQQFAHPGASESRYVAPPQELSQRGWTEGATLETEAGPQGWPIPDVKASAVNTSGGTDQDSNRNEKTQPWHEQWHIDHETPLWPQSERPDPPRAEDDETQPWPET